MASAAGRAFASSKRSLTALSHAMERLLEVGRPDESSGGSALLIALFQRPEYFELESERYARIAAGGAVCVVGFTGHAVEVPAGVTAVRLGRDEPLAAEWALVVIDGALGSALVAYDTHDLMEGETSMEVARLLSARWSFSPVDSAVEATRILESMGDRLAPAVRAAAKAALRAAEATTPSATEQRMAAVTEMLVTSIDIAHHRSSLLRAQLARERLRSETDPLTGLHNRRYLTRFMDSPAVDSPMRLAALLVDLDGLKDINDTYGHAAGDAALVSAASSLLQVTRPQDVVVRMGGDEFLIVLPGLDAPAGVQVGERILEHLSSMRMPEPWDYVPVSASIGVAMVEPRGVPIGLLDEALYASKRAGGHRVTLVDPVTARTVN